MATMYAWNAFVSNESKADVILQHEDERATWTDSMGNRYTGVIWGVDMDPGDGEDPIMHFTDERGTVVYEHLREIRSLTVGGE